MTNKILILPGDGIGQEVMPQAIKVLHAVSEKFGIPFEIVEGDIGGAAFDKHGAHFPPETQRLCQTADAILLGSVGGPIQEAHLPRWKDCEKNSILALRKTLNLNANLRPVQVYSELAANCPLKESLIQDGIDILIVRELIGDIYFGEHKRERRNGVQFAMDSAEYNEEQITAIAHRAFQFAKERQKKLTSVDKANVLETSKLWREIVAKIGAQYPEVKLENMLVDNCAMQLVINPTQFDVILTANLFGDILSDLAAALPGSLGLMPSASLSDIGKGLYEPCGGSAPDIAGKNIANPIAQILSVAMLLRYSFGLSQAARAIEHAVRAVLQAGYRTRDICPKGTEWIGTQEMGDKIAEFLVNKLSKIAQTP